MTSSTRELPSLSLALMPVVLTLVVLVVQLFYFEDFTPHVPLSIGLAITGLAEIKLGFIWSSIENGVFHVILLSLPYFSVLITLGFTIRVWIAIATVIALIYYRLTILLSPTF